ncbi:hypothetical protein Tco_0895509 [Tanacetum coccineum]|uniref:Reverse transcriptase domain-containing protein n=1 Tax=Tanacetum coccineum TaxID=301880 RepID=A0ABQ5CH15_9ASTR
MFALAHRRDRTRYCEFHNDHNHDTNDCVDLRKEIEMYIRNGWLSHLTRGAKTQNSSQNITPSGNAEKGKDQVDWKQKTAGTKVINEVLMTNKKWSPPCHESRTSPPSISIAFSSNDPIPKHCNGDNPLIIIADIRGCMIHCIYVDGGSSTEIMPGIVATRNYNCPSYLFNYNKKGSKTIMTDFMIVRAPSPYNVIPRWPGMRQLANPEKVKAVVDMISPRAIREVQSLNGKLAALGRFLAKSAEKVLMFFKMLKGCIDRKEF